MSEPQSNGDVHEVRFGERRIPFQLMRDGRNRLKIDVHPDASVTVVAPRNRTLEEILQRVKKRASWIVRQQARFERFRPFPAARQYVSGETHRYLGRQYRLKVVKSDQGTVKLIGPYIWIRTSAPSDTANVKRLLATWYREHAQAVLTKSLDACLRSARSLGVSEPCVEIRRMAKRWGSCSNSGRVILNPDLVQVPRYCIEYVIMHELCHLRVHDHSPQFFRLLSLCMPDWERRKERLDSYVI